MNWNTALVTGGAGFIGSHLVELLVADGRRVRVMDNLSTGLMANMTGVEGRVEFLQGDITDPTRVKAALRDIEVVFHLAASVFVPESFDNPQQYQRVNVEGTRCILSGAILQGVRHVVFSSTCAVYGHPVTLPLPETHPTNPLSPYAANKLAAEELGGMTASTGPAFTVLRYFNVYGSRQDPRSRYSGVISRFADALGHNQPVTMHGDGHQTRDFIHVDDVVRANLLAAGANTPHAIYNVGTGRETSIAQLSELIARIMGAPSKPAYLPRRDGDISKSVANPDLISGRLGFRAEISLENGLQALLQL
jgi:UDP-glucose 4-epimerase